MTVTDEDWLHAGLAWKFLQEAHGQLRELRDRSLFDDELNDLFVGDGDLARLYEQTGALAQDVRRNVYERISKVKTKEVGDG